MSATDGKVYRHVIEVWPPSANSIWRAYDGKVLLSKKARQWYRDSGYFITGKGERREGPWLVKLDFHPPDSRAFDLDNRIKVVLDAFTHCAWWLDDVEVECILARKHRYDREIESQVRVEICRLKKQPVLQLIDLLGESEPLNPQPSHLILVSDTTAGATSKSPKSPVKPLKSLQ